MGHFTAGFHAATKFRSVELDVTNLLVFDLANL